jgi:hypothetical protein
VVGMLIAMKKFFCLHFDLAVKTIAGTNKMRAQKNIRSNDLKIVFKKVSDI